MSRLASMRATLSVAAFVLACLWSPTESFSMAVPKSASGTALYYVDDHSIEVAPSKEESTLTTTTLPRKATIYPIYSLQELHDFLLEDDRLTAVKFYAPWCKYCQKVGLHYKKLAVELGDGVVARQAVDGKIRCVAVEYGSLTAQLMEQLHVTCIPTLQLYKGTTKLWQSPLPATKQSSNDTDPALEYPANKITRNNVKTSDLTREIKRLLAMTKADLDTYVANLEDDGVLEDAMEDAFFDNTY